MKQLSAYLHFSGNCREAMTFYQECLGGELNLMVTGESPIASEMPPAAQNDILHAQLKSDVITLLASDMRNGKIEANGAVSLMLDCSSEDELNALFAKFSEGGSVGCEVGAQFWGAIFGAVTDKFGINWLLNFEKNSA